MVMQSKSKLQLKMFFFHHLSLSLLTTVFDVHLLQTAIMLVSGNILVCLYTGKFDRLPLLTSAQKFKAADSWFSVIIVFQKPMTPKKVKSFVSIRQSLPCKVDDVKK